MTDRHVVKYISVYFTSTINSTVY